jgi:hypothetical protein
MTYVRRRARRRLLALAAPLMLAGALASGTMTKTLFVHCTSCVREA